MACTKYKRVTQLAADGTATDSWYDMTASPPTLLPAKPEDAVPCVDPQYLSERVCATPTDNVNAETGDAIDPTLVVKNVKCLLPVTPECDGTTTIGAQMLIGPDGADISESHAVVACPIVTTISSDYCGAAGEGGEKREAVTTP